MITRFDLVAKAIEHIIRKEAKKSDDLLMFRLYGIEPAVYESLLFIVDQIDNNKERIEGKKLIVKTAQPINRFEKYVLPEDKTMTHFRNHLSSNEIFISIENSRISDAQGLQNLHPITEYELTNNYLSLLIDLCVRELRRIAPEFEKKASIEPASQLRSFLNNIKPIMPLQLKLTTSFLVAIIESVKKNQEFEMQWHIGNCLNELQFFRDPTEIKLSNENQVKQSMKRLQRNREAVQLRNKVLNEADIKRWYQTISQYKFIHTTDIEEEILMLRERMYEFLTSPVTDAIQRALFIDFRDVENILGRKKDGMYTKLYNRIIDEVEKAIIIEDERKERLEPHKDLLEELKLNLKPQDEGQVEHLIKDLESVLPNTLTTQLKNRLTTIPTETTCTDFVQGLFNTLTQLLESCDGTDHLEIKIKVLTSWESQRKETKSSSVYARKMFHYLYGGIEKISWERLDWDLSSLMIDEEDDDSGENRIHIRIDTNNDEVENYLVEWLAPNSENWLAGTYEAAQSLYEYMKVNQTSLVNFLIKDGVVSAKEQSISDWYHNITHQHEVGLRQSNNPFFSKELKNSINEQIDLIGNRYLTILEKSLHNGMLSVDLEELMKDYSSLQFNIASISGNEERKFYVDHLYYWLTITDNNKKKLIFPIHHPLKWLWHQNRVRFWSGYMESVWQFMKQGNQFIQQKPKNEVRSSFGFPIMSILHNDRQQPIVARSTFEDHGYEVFSLSSDLSQSHTEERLNEDLIYRIYDEYLTVYPFARDQLDVCLIYPTPTVAINVCESTNKYIQNQIRKKKSCRIHITIYVKGNASLIYEELERIYDSLDEERDQIAPLFSVRVESKDLESFQFQSDQFIGQDIVLWPDMIRDLSYLPSSVMKKTNIKKILFNDYIRSTGPLIKPFSGGNDFRSFELNEEHEPDILQSYYQMAAAASHQLYIRENDIVKWEAKAALGSSKKLLKRLHDYFNWVCIIDAHVDIQMVEQLFDIGEVSIIHFMPFHQFQGDRHLTISTSNKSQSAVQRKVVQKLRHLLHLEEKNVQRVANTIVQETRRVSSDILMKSLGPNYFMNEFIGLLAAYQAHEKEKYQIQSNPNLIHFWLRLDDYQHWFSSGKRPDLAYVTLEVDTDNYSLEITVDLIEVKLVQENSLKQEVGDAQRQLLSGYQVISSMWDINYNPSLIASSFKELYEAIVHHVQVRAGSHEESLISQWIPFFLLYDPSKVQLNTKGFVYAFAYNMMNDEMEPKIYKSLTIPSTVELPEDWFTCSEYSAYGLHSLLKEYVESKLAKEPNIDSDDFEESSTLLDSIFKEMEHAQNKDDNDEVTGQGEEDQGEKSEPSFEGTKFNNNYGINITGSYDGDRAAEANNKYQQMVPTTIKGETRKGPDSGEEFFEIDPEKTMDDEKVLHSGWNEYQSEPVYEVDLPEADELARLFRIACQSYRIQIKECDPSKAVVGPTVWRFFVTLSRGQRLEPLRNSLEDIGREMRRSGLLINMIPNSDLIALDIPRLRRETISLKYGLSQLSGIITPEQMPIVIGITPENKCLIRDLGKMPHLLVGGTTGSGKTVFLYSILSSLLLTHPDPRTLRIVLSTSKPEDFAFFNGLPHLENRKIIDNAEEAIRLLETKVKNAFEERLDILVENGCRDIGEYNLKYPEAPLPPLVVVVDEFADLADQLSSDRQARDSFYTNVRRIAQLGRSRGIHLVLCTQRPSADLVPTNIRNLMNARVCLRVNDSIASRMILEESGGEQLQLHGDLLFKDDHGLTRAQSYFTTTTELQDRIKSLRS